MSLITRIRNKGNRKHFQCIKSKNETREFLMPLPEPWRLSIHAIVICYVYGCKLFGETFFLDLGENFYIHSKSQNLKSLQPEHLNPENVQKSRLFTNFVAINLAN